VIHDGVRTELSHLTVAKQNELDAVVRMLFAGFEDALKGRNAPHRKAGRILKVILYGSYARGDWVADPVGGYFSDYDVLVLVNHDDLADMADYWSAAEASLEREMFAGGLSTTVNLIVHGIDDLNRHLRRGRPFFTDILKDGILLYDAPGHPLERPAPLTAGQELVEARRYHDDWLPSADKFIRAGRFLMDDDAPREAAFQFHQAAERLYHGLLLVRTLYSPKSHRLGLLRSQAERVDPELFAAWPRSTRADKRGFELLRRAYVDARYSQHYRVSGEELDWMEERLRVLQELVERSCALRLEAISSESDR
jgi:predicted nucleotidyltransferase/HEPN domain-containing protein